MKLRFTAFGYNENRYREGANIELWQYKIYENGIINIEEIYKRTEVAHTSNENSGKNPVMVAAGKKAAETRRNAIYTIEEHINKLNSDLTKLLNELREYIVDLDSSIEEIPKKHYIAYKTTQNFVCIETQRKKIVLYLKVNPDEIEKMPNQARDVRQIGHFGTGDLGLTIKSMMDFEETKELISLSLKNIGG